MKHSTLHVLSFLSIIVSSTAFCAANVIEKQLADIGSISNDEVVVVQRKYTRKSWRSEITPFSFGGVPFGTVQNSLFGGASYTLHANDWLGLELFNFEYTKTFFTGFTSDVNANNPNSAAIEPYYQKLLYMMTGGIQISPFYGKLSTFSQYIAYIEPYLAFGGGIAKTETSLYPTFYPAAGIRIFFREWVSLKLELRDYIYTETYQSLSNPPVNTSALEQNWAVMVSLSFWLPKMPR
jgi:outer membrane beta-barrel protein